jgi:hypothetical protein
MTPSLMEAKLGKWRIRARPAPLDLSPTDTVSVGGVAPGTKTSTPVMNESWKIGCGSLRSVSPSEPSSNAKTALTYWLIGQVAALHTLMPLIMRTSL